MDFLLGRKIGYLVVALSIFIAGLFLSPDRAHAHGGDNVNHQSVFDQSMGPDHAKDGHPGHCHGGSLCSGVAVIVELFAGPQPDLAASRHSMAVAPLRVLAVTFYDPPPPRILS